MWMDSEPQLLLWWGTGPSGTNTAAGSLLFCTCKRFYVTVVIVVARAPCCFAPIVAICWWTTKRFGFCLRWKGGVWHKALVVGSVSVWRRLLASRL